MDANLIISDVQDQLAYMQALHELEQAEADFEEINQENIEKMLASW